MQYKDAKGQVKFLGEAWNVWWIISDEPPVEYRPGASSRWCYVKDHDPLKFRRLPPPEIEVVEIK